MHLRTLHREGRTPPARLGKTRGSLPRARNVAGQARPHSDEPAEGGRSPDETERPQIVLPREHSEELQEPDTARRTPIALPARRMLGMCISARSRRSCVRDDGCIRAFGIFIANTVAAMNTIAPTRTTSRLQPIVEW